MSTATTAAFWDVTNGAYHADTSAYGKSMLDDFRSSRKRFYARYVACSLPPREETQAMRLGSLVHTAVLEPARWRESICMMPLVDRRTKEGKAKWNEFVESSAGKIVVDDADLALVNGITDAVRAHPQAKHLLSLDGPVEASMRWTCQETGLPLKCRFDKICGGSEPVVLDLKTARDVSPEAFAKACHAFGYARQASHYLDGFHALYGDKARFVFIAVETEPPHEVALYELCEDSVAHGYRQLLATKQALADCLSSGDWAAPHEHGINVLTLPRYSFTTDYEME